MRSAISDSTVQTAPVPAIRESQPSPVAPYREFQLQVNALVVEADDGNIMAVSILRRLHERFVDLTHQMYSINSTASNIRSSYTPGEPKE